MATDKLFQLLSEFETWKDGDALDEQRLIQHELLLAHLARLYGSVNWNEHNFGLCPPYPFSIDFPNHISKLVAITATGKLMVCAKADIPKYDNTDKQCLFVKGIPYPLANSPNNYPDFPLFQTIELQWLSEQAVDKLIKNGEGIPLGWLKNDGQWDTQYTPPVVSKVEPKLAVLDERISKAEIHHQSLVQNHHDKTETLEKQLHTMTIKYKKWSVIMVLLGGLVIGGLIYWHEQTINSLKIDFTDLKAEIATLAQAQKEDLTAQVQLLKDENAVSTKQQNEQLATLAQQSTKLEIDLKAEIATLAQAQKEDLTAQVQLLKDENAVSTKQQNEQLATLAQQSTKLETDLKAEMATLAKAQALENLTAQVQTLKTETTDSIQQHNQQLEKLVQQSAQIKTDLEKVEKATQTQAQQLEKLKAQVQTLKDKTTASIQQQNKQPKTLIKRVIKRVTTEDYFQGRLKDGGLGPKMVVIPAGKFQMGNFQGNSDEKPVHWVSISKFAIGKYEVTFKEYDKFANATGREKPDDEVWGRGDRPVINVSWHDAVAYTEWLSKQTGKQYRLPSEAEWEYAACAGTKTKYWWGNEIGQNRANCKGCGSQWAYKTAPVGSFKANKFGLYDTVGNVLEWVADYWHVNYEGAPDDGSVWKGGSFQVLRGGSWSDYPDIARAAYRSRDNPGISSSIVGFRVVRRVVRP